MAAEAEPKQVNRISSVHQQILSYGRSLGTTKSGSDWCLKALHPAFDESLSVGVPDLQSGSSVLYTFQALVDIAPPSAGTTNWDLDLLLWPDPVLVGMYRAANTTNTNIRVIENRQLENSPADTWPQLVDHFCGTVERYRMAYGSITMHMDATALTNSGAIAVAQYPYLPMKCSYANAGMGYPAARSIYAWPDLPKTYPNLVNLPGAFSGEAKDGCYVPFKIDSFDYKQTNDKTVHVNCNDTTTFLTPDTDGIWDYNIPASVADYPKGIASAINTSAGKPLVLRHTHHNVVHIAARNLNMAAHFRGTIRVAYECKVPPGSSVSSFAKTVPGYDPIAIDAYYAISRSLADGYPASFNSLETILDTIFNLASTILPTIVPEAAPFIAPARVAYDTGKMVVKKILAKKGTKVATAQAQTSKSSPAAAVNGPPQSVGAPINPSSNQIVMTPVYGTRRQRRTQRRRARRQANTSQVVYVP